jgi:serine/threonine protein kinase
VTEVNQQVALSMDQLSETDIETEGTADGGTATADRGTADTHVPPSPANIQIALDTAEFSASTLIAGVAPLPSLSLSVPSTPQRDRSQEAWSTTTISVDKESPRISVDSVGPQHFELLKLIGEGAFGKVILVSNRFTQQLHAMKVISKKLLRKKNSVQQMISERNILTKLSHPFVVALDYAFQTDQKLFLIMEFLSGGELFYHLRKRGHMQEADLQIYAAEMVLALEFLHSKHIIHRDLKPENILLKADGNLCITDFGLAKEVLSDDVGARTLCGTSEYMVSRRGPQYLVVC